MTTSPATGWAPTPSSALARTGDLGRAAVAAVGVASMALLSQVDGPVLCPVRLCTGHACPGCGLSRGIGALTQGDLGASVRFHPLAIAFVAQALVLSLGWLIASRLRSERAVAMQAHLRRSVPYLLYVNAAVATIVWLLRWRLGLLETVLSG